MKKIFISLSFAFFLGIGYINAQQEISIVTEAAPKVEVSDESWFHAGLEETGLYGVNTEKAVEFLKEKKRKPVTLIVGVLDSGVENTHEDLAANMWVNEKEIAGNGKDDDGNGYIDDVFGWNFIGGKDGKNVNEDTLEVTRLYAELKKKFTGEDIAQKNKEEYEKFLTVRADYEKQLAEASARVEQYSQLLESAKLLSTIDYFGDQKLTEELLSSYKSEDPEINQSFMVFGIVPKEAWEGRTFKEFTDEMTNDIQEAVDHFKSRVDYYLNPEFDPRPIVGDDYANVKEKNYGNADANGPDSFHGTHVAGLIAAVRDNEIGINGVGGNNIKIMSLRTVPNGDERDKDVANSIRYAVDNGAKILNMSFGKPYSPDREIVWDAFKYAASKNVLIVKAAGNDNINLDEKPHYPTNLDNENKKVAEPVITVGASGKDTNNLKSSFSNYGQKSVDVFSPGSQIYSTIPVEQGTYGFAQGTSMASPIVAGVAALVWSHYPKLTAVEIKDIILGSVNKHPQLESISITGGVVDAYKAVQLAEELYKTKKLK